MTCSGDQVNWQDLDRMTDGQLAQLQQSLSHAQSVLTIGAALSAALAIVPGAGFAFMPLTAALGIAAAGTNAYLHDINQELASRAHNATSPDFHGDPRFNGSAGDDGLQGVDIGGAGSSCDLAENGTFKTVMVSPLVIDLDGDGVELIAVGTSDAFFDLDVDGFAEKTGWVGANDALLALDVDGDGIIDDGSELFGDQTALRCHPNTPHIHIC